MTDELSGSERFDVACSFCNEPVFSAIVPDDADGFPIISAEIKAQGDGAILDHEATCRAITRN